MNKAMILPATLLLVATLSGCAQVSTGEVGLKKSMGVMNKKLLGPGFHTFNPFMEELDVVSVQQTTVSDEASPLTIDSMPITLHYKVQYRFPVAKIYDLYSAYKGDPYQSLVVPQIQEAFRQVVSQYKADEVIARQNEIRVKVLAHASEKLKGLVYIADIPITGTTLPQDLQNAIRDKQVMEKQAQTKANELEKEKMQAQITRAQAEAQAYSLKVQSEAAKASPAIVELEWIKKWNGQLPTYITGSGQGVMMVTPGK